MTTDQTDYELFVSYARKDNKPIPDTYPHGWVTAVKDFILADHRQYSADPMRVFFDTSEIRDMDDWRNRILGALRRSKVLLVCLSPNYFASGPCRWEWDEYLARQAHTLLGSESHATVYFVEVPGSGEQENAKRLDAIRAKNFTDLRPWFPTGAAAMQEEAVRGRMAALGDSVWERVQRARRALSVPGNLRAMTPYFIGRTRELADLHKLVGVGKIGLIAAVHGLGGQGKTELSVAYARGYADCYPLGLWALEAENETDLLSLVGKLAFKKEFGYTPSEAAKADMAVAGQEVLAEMERRFREAKAQPHTAEPATLLLLDNVSDPGLLAANKLTRFPKLDWLRVIATTRLDPNPLDPAGKSLGTVLVDALDEETAVKLIANHLPGEWFASPADEAAAREIVKELGGFTLAVEQVAVFLAVNTDVTPADYLARLRAEGLHTTDALVDDDTAGQMEHQQKKLGPVLAAMLAPLSDAARTLLRFASLLPPDSVPWPWLKELTLRHHPELGDTRPGYPDPWVKLRRQVEGLRFLTGSVESEFARMHRLVGVHLRQSVTAEMDEELTEYVNNQRYAITQSEAKPADWELDALLESIPHLLHVHGEQRLASGGTFLSDKVLAYRTLSAARKLLVETGAVLKTLADADPTSADKQRDLSVSFNKLGGVAVAAGDLIAAKGYFTQSLGIRVKLAVADLTSAAEQRDLSISFIKLGEVAVAAGDLSGAKGYFTQSLGIAQKLADADPTSADKQRDLSISFNWLGNVAVAAGDLKAAKGYYEQHLGIAQKLADADPTSAQKQRDLSISYVKMGEVAEAAGDLSGAKGYYEQHLTIARKLADADPTSAQKQRDIAVSYSKLATVAEKANDAQASKWWRQCLAVFERMIAAGLHMSPGDLKFIDWLRRKLDG